MTRKITIILLIILTILLVLMAGFSFRWRMIHDAPCNMYLAFLMDEHHQVPYLDFFDFQAPGTYYFFFVMGKLCGYSDSAFRFVDLFLLALIILCTWKYLRNLGFLPAWYATVVFSIFYLSTGPVMSLQREFILLVPLSAALYLTSRSYEGGQFWKWLISGLCLGLAATIKPHAAIALPVIIAMYLIRRKYFQDSTEKSSSFVHLTGALVGGFIIPFVLLGLVMWRQGSLNPFLDMARHYWPLYAQLSGRNTVLSGWERIRFLFEGSLDLGGFPLWLVPASLGSFILLSKKGEKPSIRVQAISLLIFSLVFFIYPLFSSKFWLYHWLPFFYFIILTSSLCLVDSGQKEHAGSNALVWILHIVTILVLISLSLRPSNIIIQQIQGESIDTPKLERVDKISTFLEGVLTPEDRVQPLDWTGGAAHALLVSRARLATSFLYDFHFYHHVSNPYIVKLQKRFLNELMRVRPRFIIRVTERKQMFTGPDTNPHFKPLQDILTRQYRPVLKGSGFTVFERGM